MQLPSLFPEPSTTPKRSPVPLQCPQPLPTGLACSEHRVPWRSCRNHPRLLHQLCRGRSFLTSSPTLVIFCFVLFVYSSRLNGMISHIYEIVFHCCFHLHFPNDSFIWTIFSCTSCPFNHSYMQISSIADALGIVLDVGTPTGLDSSGSKLLCV